LLCASAVTVIGRVVIVKFAATYVML